jgi:hypothetical protein
VREVKRYRQNVSRFKDFIDWFFSSKKKKKELLSLLTSAYFGCHNVYGRTDSIAVNSKTLKLLLCENGIQDRGTPLLGLSRYWYRDAGVVVIDTVEKDTIIARAEDDNPPPVTETSTTTSPPVFFDISAVSSGGEPIRSGLNVEVLDSRLSVRDFLLRRPDQVQQIFGYSGWSGTTGYSGYAGPIGFSGRIGNITQGRSNIAGVSVGTNADGTVFDISLVKEPPKEAPKKKIVADRPSAGDGGRWDEI